MSCLKRVLFLIMTPFLSPSFTQNLVPNPSFENNTGCPGPTVFLTNTVDWHSIPDHSGTPDLFWKDCGYNGIGQRNTMAHDQLPKEGLAFIGMFCWGDALREYSYTELKEPLIAGTNYKVTFWIRPAAGYGTAINSFGAHLSAQPVHGNGTLAYLPLKEHIGLPLDQLLTDTTQWHQIEGTYTAMGGEKYLTFGNFRSDNETMQKIIQTNCIRSDRSYILLDDVSVIAEQSNQTSVLSDKKEIQRVTKSVFYAKSNEIELQLWDHNREDGDSVTILLNSEVIAQDIAIMKQIKTYNITLNENINYIELQAINLGLVPPNTVALRISDGHSEKKIILSSTMSFSEAVKIVVEL